MPLKRGDSDRKEPRVFSRRTLLSGGFGLAAAACGSPSGGGRGIKDARAESARSNQRVVGRARRFPLSPDSEGRDTLGARYFPQPVELTINQMDNRDKNLVLEIDYRDVEFVKRDRTRVWAKVRTYNGCAPGPTIRCRAGDQLRIALKNNLPNDESFAYDYEGCTANTVQGALDASRAGLPHGFNTTNLHTHGLHVSPGSVCEGADCSEPPYSRAPALASDDVFVQVPPGAEQQYCIVLPEFHAPGTHWYHAHKHGSAGLQVNNGLVGALIVEERGDQRILGDQEHVDQIILIQEFMEPDNQNDQLVYAKTQGNTSQFHVNGKYLPRMHMTTGEIQRWRFINATSRPRGLAKLRLVKMDAEMPPDTTDMELSARRGRGLEAGGEGREMEATQPDLVERLRDLQRAAAENARPMHLVAIDGISLYGQAPQAVREWDFAPGNRADFLVRIDEPGTYAILKDVHPYAGSVAPEAQYLASIDVTEGSARMLMPSVIPGDPPHYLTAIEEVDGRKVVDFQALTADELEALCRDTWRPWTCTDDSDVDCDGSSRGCRPGGYPLLERVFAIDCARYDHGRVEDKYVVELNTAEEWTLRNFGGAGHPFHIHVNPFQVVEIFDGKTRTVFDPQSARWQDVVAIPRGSDEAPGYVKIRQRYLTFPGDFVIHCHFLNHEDMGMMKRVRVVARGGATGRPPCQRVGECSGG